MTKPEFPWWRGLAMVAGISFLVPMPLPYLIFYGKYHHVDHLWLATLLFGTVIFGPTALLYTTIVGLANWTLEPYATTWLAAGIAGAVLTTVCAPFVMLIWLGLSGGFDGVH
jgi:hypothetical protein